MSQELSALDELKGRLTFLKIQYVDTGVRLQPALETIMRIEQLAIKGPLSMVQIDELGEELADLKGYLVWLQGEYPEVQNDTKPVINVINWLLSIEENESQVKH